MSEERRRVARSERERIPTQLDVVRQVMLLAAQYDSWMTLEELARKTKFPEPSISAQLRHLRKEERGGFVVEKRRRTSDEVLRTNARERVWEYQVRG
jgi:DNA mismatch repair ATPase MutS